MYKDMGDVVREALLESGCAKELVNDFDGHSTISLNFDNRPSILVSEDNGDIILWAKLCPFNELAIVQNAASIIPFILEGFPYSVTGQLQVMNDEGELVVKAFIRREFYPAEHFSLALEMFYHQLCALDEKLR